MHRISLHTPANTLDCYDCNEANVSAGSGVNESTEARLNRASSSVMGCCRDASNDMLAGALRDAI